MRVRPGPLGNPGSRGITPVCYYIEMIRVFVALVFAVLLAAQAVAWNALGHSVIAEIAWQQLSPDRRQAIVDTLKRHPRFGNDFIQKMPREVDGADRPTLDRWIFWQAAIWPDVARGIRGNDRRLYDRPTWHYVNGPIYLDQRDRRELSARITVNLSATYPTHAPESEWNIIQAMKHAEAILRSDAAPAQERAVAYCWLFHLVGDSHQPLHSCALFSASRFPNGDRGGNDIPLMQGDNLHALWDNLLGRPSNMNGVRQRAAELQDREKLGEIWSNASTKKDVRQWLSESYDLSRTFAYDDAIREVVRRATPQQPLERIELSEVYLKAAGGHARERALAAGLRLAAVLNDIADAAPLTNTGTVGMLTPSVSMIAAPPAPPATKPAAELSHWLNTNTGVRHNQSCRWFENTSGGRKCKADEGKACQQCGG